MKCIIYLRTSTKKQEPENQLNACQQFAESRGYETLEIIQEKASAFKEGAPRPGYDRIKELAYLRQINAVVVFSVSRWIRNRDQLLNDLNLFTGNDVKFHAVKDQYIESINIPGPIGRTLTEFMIGMAGSFAEMVSLKRAEQMHASWEEGDDGKLIYKRTGSKVGRLPFDVKYPGMWVRIEDLHRSGMSIRSISRELEIPKSTVSDVIQGKRK